MIDNREYLGIFIDETKENIQLLNELILSLEEDKTELATVKEIFRVAHTLKGMAGTMGFTKMQNLTHKMEDAFSDIREGKKEVQDNVIDILFQCLDAIENYLDNIVNNGDEGYEENEELISLLQGMLGEGPEVSEIVKQEVVVQSKSNKDDVDYNDTYLISFNINSDLSNARAFVVYHALEEIGTIIEATPSNEELASYEKISECKIVFGTNFNEDSIKEALDNSEIENLRIKKQVAEEPKAKEKVKAEKAPAKNNSNKPKQKVEVNQTIRVDTIKLDNLMNLVSELIIAKNTLVSNAATYAELQNDISYVESITSNLHEAVMNVRMIPIETIITKYPRMIRDISKKLNKPMNLVLEGVDTELDRTVAEELGDPLLHILRNSADHGIEDPETRKKSGKPEVGTITFKAYRDGNNVIIDISDDGAGVNVSKVKAKAVQKGLVSDAEASGMSDDEAVMLLFKPGFSTAEQVSDLSGRGVGLDVVKSKIEGLNGEVSVTTQTGEGSTFRIKLPLTLSVVKSLMIKQRGGETYAVPVDSIESIVCVPASEVQNVNGKEALNLRNEAVPLSRLQKALKGSDDIKRDEYDILIIKQKDKRYGLIVDEIEGRKELVIKPIPELMDNSNGLFAGSTILGDGTVAVLIETNSKILH